MVNSKIKLTSFALSILSLSLFFFFLFENKTEAVSTLNGLVGYWNMDNADTNGSTVYDKSGWVNNGTISFATSTLGKFKQARSFENGTYVDVGNNTSLIAGVDSGYTFSAWVKFSNLTGSSAGIVFTGHPNSTFPNTGLILINSTTLSFYCQDAEGNAANSAIDPTSLNNGNWHLLVGVHTTSTGSATHKLYVDGLLKATATSPISGSQGCFPIGTNLRIGGTSSGIGINGNIDDVRVYKRALSANEVLGLYREERTSVGGVPTADSGTASSTVVGYWNMDYGDTQGATTILDKSGFGRNGTIVNATSSVGKVHQSLTFSNSQLSKIDLGTSIPESTNSTEAGSKMHVTWSAWTRVHGSSPANTYNVILSHESNLQAAVGPLKRMSIYNTGKLAFDCKEGTNHYNSQSPYPLDDRWHHVAVVVDGTAVRHFLDGALTLIDAIGTTSCEGSASSTFIGLGGSDTVKNNNDGQSFDGQIDEVRIHNYSLSNAQVEQLYNGSKRAVMTEGTVNGLVAYWTFDLADWRGSTIRDMVANRHSGSVIDTPGESLTTRIVTGKFGQALKIHEASGDQFITLGVDEFTSADLLRGTMTAWIKPDGPGTILDLEGELNLAAGSTSVGCTVSGISTSKTTAINNNKWHHVACTWAGTGPINLYLDGVLVDTDATAHNAPDLDNATTNNNCIGGIAAGGSSCSNGTQQYDGVLDEVRIYNRVLNAAEINQLSAATKARVK